MIELALEICICSTVDHCKYWCEKILDPQFFEDVKRHFRVPISLDFKLSLFSLELLYGL